MYCQVIPVVVIVITDIVCYCYVLLVLQLVLLLTTVFSEIMQFHNHTEQYFCLLKLKTVCLYYTIKLIVILIEP